MATSTALSTILSALAEQVAPALEGQPLPPAATLYRALIRARDEAVCLEARASDRDASVHRLLAQVETACAEGAAKSSPLPTVTEVASAPAEGSGVGPSFPTTTQEQRP